MKTNTILGVVLAVLAVGSVEAAQWKLKVSGASYGFGSSIWESMEDKTVTTTTLTADDECFVYYATINGGHSDNATFKGKSLTIGSVADNIKGYFDQYYNAKVYGSKDNVVENDGIILERGTWCTSYGNSSEAQQYPLYGKVTVNATVSEPFSIYRNNSSSSALKLMGEVKGAGWLAVKGYKATEYTLMFLGGYADFTGGVMLKADTEQSVASISRLRLPTGTCTATVTADAGCRVATYSVDAQVSLGKILLADNAVLEFQATGTGATAQSRVLNSSKFTTTTQFNAAGKVKVEVAYNDSANGKFSDAFDLLTVPASSTLDAASFEFVPTDGTHQAAEFSVRDDGATKTLVLTYVATGAELLTQAENGTNTNGLEGVKWSNGSTGTSADYNYACLGYEIYISSANDAMNAFKGNSLRIGDATSGTVGALHEYGGYGAVSTHNIMEFPNDGLILACGTWSTRYVVHYLLKGKVKVTAPAERPFRMYHGYTKDGDSSQLGASRLTLLGPLSGSGSLQIDSGMINNAWSTNFLVNVFGGASEFTGSVNLISKWSSLPGCFGRSGLGLTNGVFGGSINVGTNSFVVLPGLDEKALVKRLTLDDDAELRVTAQADIKSGSPVARVGTLEVSDNFMMNGRATLSVNLATTGSVGGDYAILTVPGESVLDAQLFDLNLIGDEFYMRDAQLKVVQDPDTFKQSLVLSIPQAMLVTWNASANDGNDNQIVNSSNKDSFTSSITNALDWSDNEPVHSGAQYLCQATAANKVLRTESNGLGQSGTFPGESLTLEGVGTRSMAFVPVHKDYTIRLLRFIGKVGLMPATAGVTIHGDLEAVSGTSYWQVYAGGYFKLDGDLSGSGAIVINGNGTGSSNPGGDVEFDGDNSGYSGRLRVYTTPSADAPSMVTDQWGRRFYERLLAKSGNSIGGAMSPADPQGVILEACTMFIPLETMTIDEATRGWQIVSNGRFNVTNEEVTMTFKSPLALYGTLYKEGAGRLELGNEALTFGENATDADPDTEDTSHNRFEIIQGSVKVLKADCLNGADIVVENGATPAFVIPTDVEDADLQAYGLRNTKAALPFSAVGDGQKVVFALEGAEPATYPATFALCTVAEGQADSVESLMTVESPRFGGRLAPATLVRGDAVDGRVTFSARVEGPRGLIIILK